MLNTIAVHPPLSLVAWALLAAASTIAAAISERQEMKNITFAMGSRIRHVGLNGAVVFGPSTISRPLPRDFAEFDVQFSVLDPVDPNLQIEDINCKVALNECSYLDHSVIFAIQAIDHNIWGEDFEFYSYQLPYSKNGPARIWCSDRSHKVVPGEQAPPLGGKCPT